MKRIIFTLALSVGFLSVAQISSSGEWLGNNDLKGNPYILASDEHMELTKQSIAAYNESDVEKEAEVLAERLELLGRAKKQGESVIAPDIKGLGWKALRPFQWWINNVTGNT